MKTLRIEGENINKDLIVNFVDEEFLKKFEGTSIYSDATYHDKKGWYLLRNYYSDGVITYGKGERPETAGACYIRTPTTIIHATWIFSRNWNRYDSSMKTTENILYITPDFSGVIETGEEKFNEICAAYPEAQEILKEMEEKEKEENEKTRLMTKALLERKLDEKVKYLLKTDYICKYCKFDGFAESDGYGNYDKWDVSLTDLRTIYADDECGTSSAYYALVSFVDNEGDYYFVPYPIFDMAQTETEHVSIETTQHSMLKKAFSEIYNEKNKI